jgi:hypothetical protein
MRLPEIHGWHMTTAITSGVLRSAHHNTQID